MSVKDAPLLLALSALRDEHAPIVGGKAASLGALIAAGFSVPEGFVLTTHAFEEMLRALDAAPDRKKLEQAELPESVKGVLAVALGMLGDVPLAVRSSGTKEDLEGSSFAGQYETVLDVRGFAALEAAVKRCWASVWSERVQAYAKDRAGGAGGLSMAVVVQRLVRAETAGVLFTANPLTGRERESVVEACFGLADALVSGKVNADSYIVDAVERRVVERKPVDPARPTLDDAALLELVELGARVQEHYGRPMDIEWTRQDGKLELVQARPITTLSFAPDTGEWTTADFRDGGVSSDVCSPFMWSLYESVLEHTLPQYFIDIRLLSADEKKRTKWSRMFFARPYWNLGAVKRVLEKIPGYDERAFDEGLGIRHAHEGVRTPTTALGVVKAIPVLLGLWGCYKEQLAADQRFLAAFEEKARPFEIGDISAMSAAIFGERFRELITGLYFETESAYFYTIYNTTNAKQDLRPHLDAAKKALPDLDSLKLMLGLRNLSHLRPIRDMHARLSSLDRRGEGGGIPDALVRDFARTWRHHGRKELDIRVPRWEDDLPFVRTMLEQALAQHDPARAPDAQAEVQHAAYLAERARVEKALGLIARRGFAKALDLVRTYAWWREEMRDRSSYAYYLVRRWAVEAARRLVKTKVLDAVDDVWYLTFQQAIAAVEGTRDDTRAQARAGRRLVRSYRNFRNPNEIGARHPGKDAAPVSSGALRGIACSPGRVEGRAKVVKNLDEASKVEKGDVLVTVFTDPGWTPLLGRVAAVVTETGGVLSHAAVISREYGIPAVLAVPGATSTLRDGQLIVVDGTHGTVELR